MFDFNNLTAPVTKNDLLKYVSVEQIFFHYFGNFSTKKTYHSPFREDKNPSFGFFYNTYGELMANDLSKIHRPLDCISFVALKHNISYYKAIQKILFDFNISNINVECKPNLIEKKTLTFENKLKQQTVIQIEPRSFNSEELEYWNQWEISQQELESENVYAYNKAYINKSLIYNREKLKFAFYQRNLEDAKGYFKLYQPYSEKYKWVSNIPLNLPFGIDKLKYESDTLIISKSKKDLLILKKLFSDVIATQNESLSAIINCVEVSKKFKRTVVIFDSDSAGVEACTAITNEYNWEYWNTPNYLLNMKIKDIPEYVFEFGLKTLEKRFKEKKLL